MDFFKDTNKISQSSKLLFNRKLEQWCNWMNRDIHYLVNHSKQSLSFLHKANISHTETNHHLYISAVVTFLRYGTTNLFIQNKEQLLEEWIQIQKINYSKIQNLKEEGKPTDKQAVEYITWNEIINTREQMAFGSQEKLLFLMYTEIPPVRADFFATEIVYFPSIPTISGENYILIKSPDNIEYVINDFKTSKLYEVIRGKLPKIICKELLKSLTIYPRKYLFIDGSTPFDRKTFSAWSTKILSNATGKHLTLTMLRHLYISEKVDFNKSIKTLNKVSRAMGHSIGMQKQYHWIEENI